MSEITKNEYNKECLELFRKGCEAAKERGDNEWIENQIRIQKKVLMTSLAVFSKEEYEEVKKRENHIDYYDYCKAIDYKPQDIDCIISEVKNS